jgi:hypothetical protein
MHSVYNSFCDLRTVAYSVMTTIEEPFEKCSIVVCIHDLLRQVASNIINVQVRIYNAKQRNGPLLSTALSLTRRAYILNGVAGSLAS